MSVRLLKSGIKRIILPRGQRSTKFEADQPLVVAGTFRTSNGIGRAAVGCYQALEELNLNPIAVDLSEGFNQVDQTSPIPLHAPFKAQGGTAIIYANPPELERALMILRMRRWQRWRIIGAWVWELPHAPAEWAPQADQVSEIWAPSSFVQSAFETAYSADVKTVPHYFSTTIKERIDQKAPTSPDSPFRVIVMADGRSSFHRKDVLSALEIFKLALGDANDVELTVKTRNLALFPEFEATLKDLTATDGRIRVIDESLPHEEVLDLIAQHHVILSPHRSEGFGITLAEAMSVGCIAMGTNWSGNIDFMNDTNAMLLPYSMERVSDPAQIYATSHDQWARVDVEAATPLLRRLYEDASLRLNLATKAKTDIEQYLSVRHYSAALGLSDETGLN